MRTDMQQATFSDTWLISAANEVMEDGNVAELPFCISYERTRLGAYIWKCYIERKGRKCGDTIGQGLWPDEAIAQAMIRYRREFGA